MDILVPEKQSIFVRASVSDVCNFSCRYCPKDLGMENHTPACIDAPLLDADAYISNLKLIAAHGFHAISFTGGEPLLNKEFPAILEGIRDTYDIIELTTNGSMISLYEDALKKYVDVLKISIDAIDGDLAKSISRNPLSANIPAIIENCCRIGIKTIGLNFVYMKENRNQLYKLVDFAAYLKNNYGTNVYISILDLYYSKGNERFWRSQFVDLSSLRKELIASGFKLNHRIRIGCDSFNFICNGVVINMKDSISCTNRADICENCKEYCQEGIYSLKHSASGWISVCPNNNPAMGMILKKELEVDVAHERIDYYVNILNRISRQENTGCIFEDKRGVCNG